MARGLLNIPELSHEYETKILIAILAINKPTHGFDIAKWLEEKQWTDEIRNTGAGAIYTALKRMLNKGWLNTVNMPARQIRGGRRTTGYEINEKGKSVLNDTFNEFMSIWVTYDKIRGIVG